METVKIEHSKGVMLAYTNKVMSENGLTATDMEGIMATIMIQLQSQSKLEMMQEFDNLLKEKEKEKEGENNG